MAQESTTKDAPALDARDAEIKRLREACEALGAKCTLLTEQLGVRESLAKQERANRAKMPYAKTQIRAGRLGTFAPGDPIPEEICVDGLVEGVHFVRGVMNGAEILARS